MVDRLTRYGHCCKAWVSTFIFSHLLFISMCSMCSMCSMWDAFILPPGTCSAQLRHVLSLLFLCHASNKGVGEGEGWPILLQSQQQVRLTSDTGLNCEFVVHITYLKVFVDLIRAYWVSGAWPRGSAVSRQQVQENILHLLQILVVTIWFP